MSPQNSKGRPADTQTSNDEFEQGFGTGLRAQLERKAPANRKHATPVGPAEKPAKPPKADRGGEIDHELARELERRSAEIDVLAAQQEQRGAELEQLQADFQAQAASLEQQAADIERLRDELRDRVAEVDRQTSELERKEQQTREARGEPRGAQEGQVGLREPARRRAQGARPPHRGA